MSGDKMGVAISTTGQAHRMRFLETCVLWWKDALPLGSALVVTVDGSEDEAAAVAERLPETVVVRIGQQLFSDRRLGVAVNKNTGIEWLMDAGVDHLFLCDDDTWPLSLEGPTLHMALASEGEKHSMLMWGKSRVARTESGKAYWTWPRGAMLYATREAIEKVGGMDERFGPGGHEHVEWSQRMARAGMCSEAFVSPYAYVADRAMYASRYWNAEDMRRPNESGEVWAARKKANTTLHQTPDHWHRIDRLMRELVGSTAFVPFRAQQQGRLSATLYSG